MSKRKPTPEMTDAENPEWTAADFKKASCLRSTAFVSAAQVGRKWSPEGSHQGVGLPSPFTRCGGILPCLR